MQERTAAIKADERVKVTNVNASLVTIYKADRAKAGKGRPLDAYGDDGAAAVDEFAT